MASTHDPNASAMRIIEVRSDGSQVQNAALTQLRPLAAQPITAATPVTIFTPAAGKRWRVLGYHLSTTVAGSILFKEAGAERFRTPLLVANSPEASPDMGDGFLASAAAATLQLDVTVTGNVSGFVVVREE